MLWCRLNQELKAFADKDSTVTGLVFEKVEHLVGRGEKS